MKAALYARVSTNKKKRDSAEPEQNPETQLLPLRDYAKARGFTVTEEYVDRLSGAKDSRPHLDRLMQDARMGRIDTVLVWRFDRFARSTRHLILALEEFQSLKVNFVSMTENIDTSSAMGKMVFTIIAAVAELERSLIRERIMAGLARAEHEGKKLGPQFKIFDREAVRQHYAQSKSMRKTAGAFDISPETVRRVVHDSTRKGTREDRLGRSPA